MKCINCEKISRCGCGSCKSRNKYPSIRAYKITGAEITIIQCPYCRKKYSEDYLLDMEYKTKNPPKQIEGLKQLKT